MKSNHFSENIEVQILGEDDPLWDQIHSSELFSIYHNRNWKNLVEENFGHQSLYIAALKDGMIIDILPFFLIKKPIFGKKIVSTPYEGCNGGFICKDVMMRKELIRQVQQYALDLKVKYVEIRSKFQYEELKEFGFVEKCPLIISELPLKGLDENWSMLSSNHRRNVRIAQNKGVTVNISSNLTEMRSFYDILATQYKQLGIPFFNEKFFIQIWDRLIQKEQACLLLARDKEEIIGGHLLFFSGKDLISKYSASVKSNEYKSVYTSYALFWEGIKLGIDRKLKYFNLGITDKSHRGLLDFKSRFGSKNSPVYFYYYSISGGVPDYSTYLSKYSLPKRIWRSAPNKITTLIGQMINEWIC
jgi:hypothetical protein